MDAAGDRAPVAIVDHRTRRLRTADDFRPCPGRVPVARHRDRVRETYGARRPAPESGGPGGMGGAAGNCGALERGALRHNGVAVSRRARRARVRADAAVDSLELDAVGSMRGLRLPACGPRRGVSSLRTSALGRAGGCGQGGETARRGRCRRGSSRSHLHYVLPRCTRGNHRSSTASAPRQTRRFTIAPADLSPTPPSQVPQNGQELRRNRKRPSYGEAVSPSIPRRRTAPNGHVSCIQ